MIDPSFPTVGIDDTLQDIRALANLGLLATENTEPDEFGRLRSDFCTMFYLIREKLDAADRETTNLNTFITRRICA